ncbi:hypothetical protein H7H82_10945 [Mycobacterium heidelbergense]|uniref:hypothetical protein n=1 Tax=Mycobacterium TaxID=1763 RepID=UPI001301EE83|nr:MULTISPECIES: hypothetical protein [Mycobacterium]MCV7051107.1 hypothetical protein [Mycobacterium heidelbergense]MEE3753414.1 hypothetical protein [Mycobacterium intracellulare]BBZ51584.1 hypothetical protein MHEI_33010 [Mycobacterium heidelbergense]
MNKPTLREGQPLLAPDYVTIIPGDTEPELRADGSVGERHLKPGIYVPGQVIPAVEKP